MVQTAKKKQRIGLLGGTFDPVHNGHLAVANHVKQVLALDAIWFIPAAKPPHKTGHADGREISSFSHRLAMLKKATADKKTYIVSDIEAKRSAPSYSIDTIKILIPRIGRQADLFFIIGVDAFLEIETWKQHEELPTLVSFVIITRPGYPPDKVGEVICQNYTGYEFNPAINTWSSPHNKSSFILQHMEPAPVSSTEIRKKVRMGEDITGLVPQIVAFYIKAQGLYSI